MKKPAMRYAAAVVLALMLLSLAPLISLYLVSTSVGRSQREWCDTLTLLTARPAAARYQNRQFYSDLVELKRRFGC